ncbi:MAG: DUF2339 domain-containing protein, partial [Candidatus Zixiibacteriota bacterium]
MNQQNDKSLERRIRELETSLTDVRRALDYLLSISDHAVTPDPAPIPEPAKTPEIQESVVEPAQSAATADPPPEPEQALARESDALAQRHSSQTAMEQAQEFSTPAGPSVSIEKFLKSEFLLNKLGIGLLLFGVVFLFKYSIDQGWITPAVRVACGLALGVALLGFGSKLYSRRHHFSLVLLGGA